MAGRCWLWRSQLTRRCCRWFKQIEHRLIEFDTLRGLRVAGRVAQFKRLKNVAYARGQGDNREVKTSSEYRGRVMARFRLLVVCASVGLACSLFCVRAGAQVYSGITMGGPTWTRPLPDGSSLSTITVPYGVTGIRVSTSGNFSFTAETHGTFDNVEFLVQQQFQCHDAAHRYFAGGECGWFWRHGEHDGDPADEQHVVLRRDDGFQCHGCWSVRAGLFWAEQCHASFHSRAAGRLHARRQGGRA